MNILLQPIYKILLALDLNWTEIFNPIHDMFMGTNTLTGIMGNEIILGLFIFVFFFILTLIFGLGMIVGSVVIIPTLFAVFQYIPGLKIIIAIILGLGVGIALNRIINR